MTEINLSSDTRRRLWQCYTLLLELAEEAERNTTAHFELGEDCDSSVAAGTSEENQSDNDYFQEGPKKVDGEPQTPNESELPY